MFRLIKWHFRVPNVRVSGNTDSMEPIMAKICHTKLRRTIIAKIWPIINKIRPTKSIASKNSQKITQKIKRPTMTKILKTIRAKMKMLRQGRRSVAPPPKYIISIAELIFFYFSFQFFSPSPSSYFIFVLHHYLYLF